MKRVLTEEILDSLPADDPQAVEARRDLRVLNRVMRHRAFFRKHIIAQRLNETCRTVTEIGAGDGSLLVNLAESIQWKHNIHANIIDQCDLISEKTRERFRKVGWSVTVVEVDLFEWIRNFEADGKYSDLVLANLFLHHFTAEELKAIFESIASRAGVMLACEPRRSSFAKLGSQLVGVLGCNAVTRHDARVSVEAGFTNSELSSLWPDEGAWVVTEKRVGLFSHFFSAIRSSPENKP